MLSATVVLSTIYVLMAVLVAIGAWGPSPEDRPGGGRAACVAIGVLWPLFGLALVVGVAFEGAWALLEIWSRRRQ
jgi:hypothetical protein